MNSLTHSIATGKTAFNSTIDLQGEYPFEALVDLIEYTPMHVGKLPVADYKRLKAAKDNQAAADKDTMWLSFAKYSAPVRNLDNVERVTGFGADLDHGHHTLADIARLLAGIPHVVHTTHSHSVDAPRFRFLIPFATPVTVADHKRLFKYFNTMFDGALDGGAKDASRLWYLRSCCADTEAAAQCAVSRDGSLFDPVPVLASLPAAVADAPKSDELTQEAVWPVTHADPDHAIAARRAAVPEFDALMRGESKNPDASANDARLVWHLLQCFGGNGQAVYDALMESDPPHPMKRDKWDRRLADDICSAFDKLNADPKVNVALVPWGGAVPAGMSAAPVSPSAPSVPAGTPPVPTAMPAPAVASPYVIQSLDDVLSRPDLEWLVDGVLPMSGLASIYGKWGTGKSFLVIDLAGSVSEGKAWFGREVKQAPVLYVVLEGDGGIKQRMQAYVAERKQKPAHLHFITGDSFNLLSGSPDIERMKAALRAMGWKGGLIIVDTLSAAIPGGNENATEVMTAAVENLKAIQREFGGLVLIVHHTGKDEAKGMRGSSSLPAALDASVEISREDSDPNQRWWNTAKVKDGPDDSRVGFKLKVLSVGQDKRGKDITSCAVVPDVVEVPDVPGTGTVSIFKPAPPPKIGPNERKVLAGLPALLAVDEYAPKEVPPGMPCIDFTKAATLLKNSMSGESNRLYSKARTALESLAEKKVIACAAGYVWMPDRNLDQQPVTAQPPMIPIR